MKNVHYCLEVVISIIMRINMLFSDLTYNKFNRRVSSNTGSGIRTSKGEMSDSVNEVAYGFSISLFLSDELGDHVLGRILMEEREPSLYIGPQDMMVC